MEIKKSTTHSEQLEILRERGCDIDDDAAAISFLRRVSYYRFSGYLAAYKNDDGTFADGLSFDQVAAIYDFDADLRGLIMKAVSEVEVTAKSVVAYYHAHRYGALGYLDASNFGGRHNHERFTEHFESAIRNNKNTLFVRHHIKTYAGKFPIWVATELFTMGMTSLFFADLNKDDKKAIANEYNTDYTYLESWLHSSSVLRNICAHQGRLYNIRFHQNPKLPREYAKYADMNIRSLFKQLYMLKMLFSNRHSQWNNAFVAPLSALVAKYENSPIMDAMGFPETWEEGLIWKPTLQKSQHYTYADYCTWGDDERWELIGGVAHAMAPSQSELHQRTSGEILYQIGQFLRGKKSKILHAPFDVRLNADTKDNTVVQPDLLVVCDQSKLDSMACIGAPDMVVEVLSPSTKVHDNFLKFKLYLQAGVREYWIVDPDLKMVTVNILKDGEYTTNVYGEDGHIPVHVLEGCTVDLAEVFKE